MTDLVMPLTRYARSGDVNIAYQVIGEGPVPGAISHLEVVYELPGCVSFLQRLSRFARVIQFDKRGQGLSDRVVGAPSLEERMDDVRAVMDAAGSRLTVLVGFSEGGPMSVLFSATYPDRISHLILIGGFIRSGFPVSDAEFEVIADMIVGNWGSGQMMKRVVGIGDENREVLARLGRFERMSCSPGAFKAILRMNRLIDVTQILPNVRIPTLVLHSRADAMTPISEGRRLAAGIPGAKDVEYDNLPHAGFTADNQELVNDLEEFVTGHRSSADEPDRILSTVFAGTLPSSRALLVLS